jgi:hypothetical protein
MKREPKPPFRVDLVDQFQGHCEYGYSTLTTGFDNLEDAISYARQITEEAIQNVGSFERWNGMGDAGLVYDSRGMLVWDGVREYQKKYKEGNSPQRSLPLENCYDQKCGTQLLKHNKLYPEGGSSTVFSKLGDGIIIEVSAEGVFAWRDGKSIPIPEGLTMGEISDGKIPTAEEIAALTSARMATLKRAIVIAAEAHEVMLDNAGAPYILHPLRVMMSMHTIKEMIAAVLHDVVEDSEQWTLQRLKEEGFEQNIIDALDALTKREKETYEEFIERVSSNAIATKVKVADLEDNMDITRIRRLTEKDKQRIERYHRAWRKLRMV